MLEREGFFLNELSQLCPTVRTCLRSIYTRDICVLRIFLSFDPLSIRGKLELASITGIIFESPVVPGIID